LSLATSTNIVTITVPMLTASFNEANDRRVCN